MAENTPPPNVTNADVALTEAESVARDVLGTLNGNCSGDLGLPIPKEKKKQGNLGYERQKTKNALKDLAESEAKLAKLGELSDKRGLKLAELQLSVKAEKKAAVAATKLLKQVHKNELQVEASKLYCPTTVISLTCFIVQSDPIAGTRYLRGGTIR